LQYWGWLDSFFWSRAVRIREGKTLIVRSADRIALKSGRSTRMTPGQAAQAADVTYATAKRWYDRWADEIKRKLLKMRYCEDWL
jgi:hypothetical protein